MKKIFYILTVLFCGTALVGLCSCGGLSKSSEATEEETKEEAAIFPSSTKVQGPLGDCFTVVERGYKPSKGSFSELTVELLRTDAPVPSEYKEGTTDVSFYIVFLDEDGAPIEETYSTSDADGLMQLRPEDSGYVKAFIPKKKFASFKVTSKMKQKKPAASLADDVNDQIDQISNDPDLDDVKEAAKTAKKAIEAADKLIDIFN